MTIVETQRLAIREFEESDAHFVLDILNQPSFIKYIADRGVRTLEQAQDYIRSRFETAYDSNSYGIFLVELKDTGEPVGMAGFVNRSHFHAPDLGFAFLPQHCGQGYAYESSAALMEYGRKTLGFKEILAITTLDNDRSVRLLEKLGFRYREVIALPDDGGTVKLFTNLK